MENERDAIDRKKPVSNRDILDSMLAGHKKLDCGCHFDKDNHKIIDCGSHGGGRYA